MDNENYFLVNHQLAINVEPLQENENIPDAALFEQLIPAPFRMASDIASLDSKALHSLKLNNESTQALWYYLQIQNQKINTLLSYVLSQQDDKQFHYSCSAFSAGNCFFNALEKQFFIGQIVTLKIFIPDESAAVFCYAEVASIDNHLVELSYQQIREEDRELLIRATLHIQSKQLKLRAAKRNQL